MSLRAVQPWRVDDLDVDLHGGDPRLLGLDDERAARRGLAGDGCGIGERTPGTEERGLEHGRGGGGGRERHCTFEEVVVVDLTLRSIGGEQDVRYLLIAGPPQGLGAGNLVCGRLDRSPANGDCTPPDSVKQVDTTWTANARS
jgi:hypothetical protein